MDTDVFFILLLWFASHPILFIILSGRLGNQRERIDRLEQSVAEQAEAMDALAADYRQALANIEISTGMAGLTQRWEDKHKRGY